ncbi:hypothetical protein [Nocardioides lijunqiniae]|uniref:hypothetical protein n=1 Tax=Nocardioides lijunqiniae TaxID=2760832 RepID=UPI001877E405|nr:hypothetical protein [Nocardioides lijunqiniae]
MTRTFVWLGDRRTVVLTFAGMLLAGLVPVLSHGTDWLGSWKLALDRGTFSLTLVGPVAAGVACTAYVRLTTSGVEPLVQTARRPWWPWLRPALATWCLAAAAVLVTTLGVTVAAQAAGSAPFPRTLWVLVPALCVLAAQVAVGVLLGGLGRRRWLAPVAAAATFGLGVLGAVGVIPEVFRTGGLTGSYAGETFDVATHLLQAGAALGIAAGLLTLSDRAAVWRSLGARAVVLVLVLGGGACYVALGRGTHETTRPLADPALVCRGQAPRVCLARETTRPLDDLVRRMEQQAVALTEIGIELPPRWVQHRPGAPAGDGDGALELFVEEELAGEVSDETVARSLATPADCPAYRGDVPPPEASFDTRRLLARWLLVHAGLLEPGADDQDRAWLASGTDEQRPWVLGTYDRLRACRLDELRLPAGV